MTGTCPVHPSVTLVEDTSYDVPREYCPRCESGDQSGTERQTTAPSGTDPLDFERQREAESGDQCPARQYNDSEEPCAHQCTVRKAALGGLEDAYGDVDVTPHTVRHSVAYRMLDIEEGTRSTTCGTGFATRASRRLNGSTTTSTGCNVRCRQ